MTRPLITIGIPFFNCRDYLLDAVRSVFAQTFEDWELILVDDGSTDGGLEIAQSIDDPRVRIISDGCNKKLPARLNQIIELARGEYIARMDADDLCLKQRIEKQLAIFRRETAVDVVGTGIVYLDRFDKPIGHYFAPSLHADICREPNRTFGICHASIVAKASWYKKNRYDESVILGQDFNLWLRSYKTSKFANVPEPLYGYRLETSFAIKKQLRDRLRGAKFLFDDYIKQKKPCKAVLTSTAQYGKAVAEVLLCMAGFKQKLLSRRFTPISRGEGEFYLEQIRKIKDTTLPIRNQNKTLPVT